MLAFSDETALVTGAGSGIGSAIARTLAAEGVTVVVNDIDTGAAAETVDHIENDGGDAMTGVADVTDIASVRSMVSGINDEIDILINNAGWDRLEVFVEQDPEQWDRIIDINFRGQINCSRVIVERLMERGDDGTIVNMSSDAGRVGSTGEAVYSGAKGGVIAFTKTLARELARYDINCNVVCPGPTDTPFLEESRSTEIGEKIVDGMEDHIPLGRIAEPDDIANAVTFLASPQASYITGQTLSVSGGLTMV